MGKFSAVVYTAGRTGSHLIVDNLCKHYNVLERSDINTNFTDGIVHTHNPLYNPPAENFIAIISRRRNLFESILSMELTKITNEFTIYTNKEIKPYNIDPVKFKGCYFFQKIFYQIIDRTGFQKVIDVYYEDLISNPNCLLSDFNITLDLSTGKSPYDYYELITNIDELKELYLDLDSKALTQADLNIFRQTVEADLKDIAVNFNGNRP